MSRPPIRRAATPARAEPQKRPMTVEDLLRHTSGLVYEDGNTAVHKLYRESELYDTGLARDGTLKDFVSRLAQLPLAHQPGEVWEYGHSSDVLGRVIEVASGRPLDQFLDSRLFRPLGMVDTGSRCRRRSSPAGRSPVGAGIFPTGTSPSRPRCSRAAAGWCRQPRTISGSARCCSTAVSSTERASFRPRPSAG